MDEVKIVGDFDLDNHYAQVMKQMKEETVREMLSSRLAMAMHKKKRMKQRCKRPQLLSAKKSKCKIQKRKSSHKRTETMTLVKAKETHQARL